MNYLQYYSSFYRRKNLFPEGWDKSPGGKVVIRYPLFVIDTLNPA